MTTTDEEIEIPAQEEGKIPRTLLWVYGLLVLWGVVFFFLNWDGSCSLFDPGAWKRLQQAANTTLKT